MSTFHLVLNRILLVIITVFSLFQVESVKAQKQFIFDEIRTISRDSQGLIIKERDINGNLLREYQFPNASEDSLPLLNTKIASDTNKNYSVKTIDNGLELSNGISRHLLKLPENFNINNFSLISSIDFNRDGKNDIGLIYASKKKKLLSVIENLTDSTLKTSNNVFISKVIKRKRKKGKSKFIKIGNTDDETAIGQLKNNKIIFYGVKRNNKSRKLKFHTCVYPCKRLRKKKVFGKVDLAGAISPVVIDDGKGNKLLSIAVTKDAQTKLHILSKKGRVLSSHSIPNGIQILGGRINSDKSVSIQGIQEADGSKYAIRAIIKTAGSETDFTIQNKFILNSTEEVLFNSLGISNGKISGVSNIPTENPELPKRIFTPQSLPPEIAPPDSLPPDILPPQPLPPEVPLSPPGTAAVMAFPGAEGAGASTSHGRGGNVIAVTSLADSGKGTLREALEAEGARIVIFKVGGEIKLNSPLVISNPNIMIAGQSAPGDGIAISGHQLIISTHDVVLRYLRFRTDGYVQGEKNQIDSIEIWPNYPWNPFKGDWAYNIVIDQCSVSWASDENISTNGLVRDTTVQWSIISEGLHQIPGSGRGMILSPLSKNISIHHNLFAHNPQRNPLSRGASSFDFRNNVIYNWRYAGISLEAGWEPYKDSFTVANIVANYFKKGLDLGDPETRFHRELPNLSRIFVSGNYGPRRESDSMDDWLLTSDQGEWTSVAPEKFRSKGEFNFPLIKTTSAKVAYEEVLAKVGARKPKIDAVDERIINSTRSGTGKVINVNISEVGGMPKYKNGNVLVDSDNDGMPDEWEIKNGLNVKVDDSSADTDGNGYSNIEDYLNFKTF